MIKDALVEASFLVAATASSVSGSIGLDLNPDFGNGQSPRKAGMPGAGADFAIKCRVLQSFAVGAGAPILQVHAVLSTAGNPNLAPPTLVNTGDYVIVGSNCGPANAGADLAAGYVATDLSEKDEFYIKCNPWTNVMGRAISGAVNGEDLRYLGLILNITNYAAGVNAFSAGIIQGNVVLASDVSQQAINGVDRGPIHFPSGVVNK